MIPLIAFENVTISVRNKNILSGVSFSLNSGEKAVFRGQSGSGKSTVLKSLLGIYPLTEGKIWFQGMPLNKTTASKIRGCAAYIGQEPVLGAETVREALLLPFRFKAHRHSKPNEQLLLEALNRVHLPGDILAQACKSVSGGEKQRIALARAILMGKSLYLLDEVTSALDADSKQAVIKVFSAPDLTLLSAAHDPEWVAFCGVAYDLSGGRLIQERRNACA
jgi:putative ABC transport system ATP-binding protein